MSIGEQTAYAKSRKQIALEAIKTLPEDCTFEDVAERIAFIRAVEEGIDQLNRGESVAHEDVRLKLDTWLRK